MAGLLLQQASEDPFSIQVIGKGFQEALEGLDALRVGGKGIHVPEPGDLVGGFFTQKRLQKMAGIGLAACPG